jgi:hypothetical protein
MTEHCLELVLVGPGESMANMAFVGQVTITLTSGTKSSLAAEAYLIEGG